MLVRSVDEFSRPIGLGLRTAVYYSRKFLNYYATWECLTFYINEELLVSYITGSILAVGSTYILYGKVRGNQWWAHKRVIDVLSFRKTFGQPTTYTLSCRLDRELTFYKGQRAISSLKTYYSQIIGNAPRFLRFWFFQQEPLGCPSTLPALFGAFRPTFLSIQYLSWLETMHPQECHSLSFVSPEHMHDPVLMSQRHPRYPWWVF